MSSEEDFSEESDDRENTGRWTMQEHTKFLEGLRVHGKGWKQIALMIKTRSVVQIRTHAQKYFQKLSKAQQSAGGAGAFVAEVFMDTRPTTAEGASPIPPIGVPDGSSGLGGFSTGYPPHLMHTSAGAGVSGGTPSLAAGAAILAAQAAASGDGAPGRKGRPAGRGKKGNQVAHAAELKAVARPRKRKMSDNTGAGRPPGQRKNPGKASGKRNALVKIDVEAAKAAALQAAQSQPFGMDDGVLNDAGSPSPVGVADHTMFNLGGLPSSKGLLATPLIYDTSSGTGVHGDAADCDSCEDAMLDFSSKFWLEDQDDILGGGGASADFFDRAVGDVGDDVESDETGSVGSSGMAGSSGMPCYGHSTSRTNISDCSSDSELSSSCAPAVKGQEGKALPAANLKAAMQLPAYDAAAAAAMLAQQQRQVAAMQQQQQQQQQQQWQLAAKQHYQQQVAVAPVPLAPHPHPGQALTNPAPPLAPLDKSTTPAGTSAPPPAAAPVGSKGFLVSRAAGAPPAMRVAVAPLESMELLQDVGDVNFDDLFGAF